jgi:eukaryotic-like serine/threonine-protein kinase
MQAPTSANAARFGPFLLDLKAGELHQNGGSVRLQEQPFQVLKMLLEHPGEVVTREEIRRRLWPNDTIVEFDQGINAAIKKLRLALEDSADAPRYVETVARRGYRLVVPVQWAEPQPAASVVKREVEPRSVPAADGSLVGKKISHYRVLQVIGGGGMGVVYAAEDLKLGRRVALKFLPAELSSDPVALGRFEREARAASALDHPNICTVYEFGEHEGQPFIVMQFLEGKTLRERLIPQTRSSARGEDGKTKTQLRVSPFAIDELLELATQISDGLEAAHQKGIIHRDIKPANIFITQRGEAKILDFGLAKLTHTDDQEAGQAASARPNIDLALTRTGIALGTAAYMSPEQVQGEKLDARTDLFSFGLVLYEMATGQQAFSANTAPELHDAILHRTPRPVRELNPALPAKLEEIVSRALEKDRELRYQSAAELGAELRRLRPTPEAPDSYRQRPLRIAVVGALLLAIAAAFWFAVHHSSPVSSLPLKQRQLTANPPENAVVSGAISPDGRYLAYADLKGLHVKLIETGETRNVPQPEELKGVPVTWGIVSNWVPDGSRFVANAKIPGHPPSIWAIPVTGEPRKLRDDTFAEAASRDGSWIAFGRRYQEMWVMKSDGGQERKVFQAAAGDGLYGGEWSPDGQRLLYNYFHQMNDGGEYTLESRDLAGGPRVTAVASHRVVILDWTWLPNGRVLYSIAEPGAASEETCNYWTVRLDLGTGKPSDEPRRVTNWAGLCADTSSATADSKRLAFRRWAWQGHVDVADLEAGGTRISHLRRLTQTEGRNFPASWTTDSRAVVFGSYRDGQWKIFRQSLNQDAAEPIVSQAMVMWGAQARVSPDGAWILYMAPPLDQSAAYVGVRLMRAPITGGPSELVLAAHIPQYGNYHDPLCAQAPATLCVITEESDDGKQLIFTAFDPVGGRGRELVRFDGSNRKAYDWDLSPDGKRMAILRQSESRIHVVPLDGKSPFDIGVKSRAALETVNWTADGNGLYAASVTPQGSALLRIDFQGNTQTLWQHKGSVTPWGANLDLLVTGSPTAPWAVPSPDGRHLAIYSGSISSNMWLMENF